MGIYNGVGGIVGRSANSKIENCSFSGNVTAKGESSWVGGIVGECVASDYEIGVISKCRNTATINSENTRQHVGGIVGDGDCRIRYCYNQGNITLSCNYVAAGGIAGHIMNAGSTHYKPLIIQSCYDAGSISAAETITTGSVGGIFGDLVLDAYFSYLKGIYYLDGTGTKGIGIIDLSGSCEGLDGNAEGKTSTAFENGEVAWLLQNAADDADGQIWGQTIGKDAYPVFANESGSNVVYKVTFKVDGKDDQAKYANKGGTVSIDNPTAPTGYHFDGWYTAQEGGTKFDLSSAITADTTLYARFVLNAYTVSYNAGANGTGTVAADSKTHGVDFTLSSNTFTRTGYTQTGWATTDGGEKVYDLGGSYTGNAALTLYPVWADITAPVISGITNGTTYCSAQTVTVSDNDGISSVTVNGNPVTPDTNGQFTLSAAEGEQKIVVTDKAGNQTEMTVTVNDGHTYEWQSENGKYWQKCKFCGIETAKKDIPEIIINGEDKVCKTQDYTFTATLFEGAVNPKYSYDNDFMGSGDLNFGAIDGVYTATVSSSITNEVSEFNVTAYAETSDGYIVSVTKTVAVQSEHTGGTATCVDKAKCEVCGEEYGEINTANHTMLKHIEAKAATVTETGNTEYWHCEECGKYFGDKDCKNEIDLKDTVIGKLPPEIIDGKGQSITEGEKKELTFRSNGVYNDFIRVEVDGKTVDGKNYTVKEGSTVVTLNADYVATLSAGEHTLGIVSESGTAETTFTVNAKAVDTTSPQTGDNSHMVLWTVLLLVSGGAFVCTVAYGKKRKYSAK